MQTIDLSKVGIQSTQLQKSVVFVLGGPGSGKGTQVRQQPERCTAVQEMLPDARLRPCLPVKWKQSSTCICSQWKGDVFAVLQCSKLVQEFGLLHLSAGDLLRAHMKSGTPDGTMVAEMIKQGQIVPSHVTISLLQKAMADSKQSKVLIDGFPRNDENRAAYETQVCAPAAL